MAAFVYAFVFALTALVSAALLFVVQPMLGKVITIRLGGTPAVWNTCVVVYQLLLLGGYLYAYLLHKLPGRRWQPFFHLALLSIPLLLFLPLDLSRFDGFPGESIVLETIKLLLVVVGVPMLLVGATAPLVQKWLADTEHPSAHDPYFLYAASNMGSLLALAAFPVWIEANVSLSLQNRGWFIAFGVLTGLICLCGLLVWLSPRVFRTAPEVPAMVISNIRPTMLRRLRWLFLAAVPTSLMLGLTSTITLDIAPGPLFWGVPLALYLFTFILAFARIPLWEKLGLAGSIVVQTAYGFGLVGCAILVLLIPASFAADCVRAALIGLLLLMPYRWVIVLQPIVLLVVVALMFCSENILSAFPLTSGLMAFYLTARLCHGELARDRPGPAHLTEYYLWIATGGLLGSTFNVFLAPLLFVRGLAEYPMALCLGCTARPPWLRNGLVDWLICLIIESGSGAANAGRRLHRVILAYSFDLLGPLLALGIVLATVGATYARIWGPNNTDLQTWLQEKARQGGSGWTYNTTRYYEVLFMFGLPLLFCLLVSARPIRFGLSLLAVCLVFGLDIGRKNLEDVRYSSRNQFGFLRVTERMEFNRGKNGDMDNLHSNILMHGSTHHGSNFLKNASKADWGNIEKADWGNIEKEESNYQRLATTYYHRRGPAGIVMERFNWFPGPENTYWADARLPASLVGLCAPNFCGSAHLCALAEPWTEPPIAVLGLGTGTMASYGRPYQQIDFFEIDQGVIDLSLPPQGRPTFFHFLADAKKRGARIRVIPGDGRLAMQKQSPDGFYQAIFVDAFSSDAVPVHLLTREAMQIYFQKLAPGGMVCFHTSNRHVDLTLVIADVAGDLGYSCVRGKDGGVDLQSERGHFNSEWVMVARSPEDLSHLKPPPDLVPLNRPPVVVDTYWQSLHGGNMYIWTDEVASLTGIARNSGLPSLMKTILFVLLGLTLILCVAEVLARTVFP